MADSLQLPYEVSHTWPQEWDLLPLLRGTRTSLCEGPARFLHPGAAVQLVPGRGRGVVATNTLEPGELLLLDSPLITAPAHAELLEVISSKAKDNTEFRRQLLSMCGNPEDETARADIQAEPSAELVRNIVRHNYHTIEAPPVEGDLTVSTVRPVGLWPLASIINHGLRPNVTRTFAGDYSCYRVIRSIKVGEEVLDNYCDLRFPYAMRQESLSLNHAMNDEGPDAFDAPSQIVKEIQKGHTKANKYLGRGTIPGSQSACKLLSELAKRCDDAGVTDPTFSNVFRDFALVLAQLGEAEMSLNVFAQALELSTVREPYNLISCVLALRMLHTACLATDDIDEDMRRDLDKLAREHCRMVYGPSPEIFEILNPDLVRRLAALSLPCAATATASTTGAEGKAVEAAPDLKRKKEEGDTEAASEPKRTRED